MKDAAMKDETAAEQATDHAELTNAVGLHARPSETKVVAIPILAGLHHEYRKVA